MGPNNNYRYYGYYDFEAKAGLNSGKLVNRGKRYLELSTGEKYELGFTNVQYEGVFLGTLRESTIGTIQITDKKNKLHFKAKLGEAPKRTADYFAGTITKN